MATADIYYQLGEKENYLNILEELEKEKSKQLEGTKVLDSAIEATEKTTRSGIMNEQVGNIKQLTKEKDERSKWIKII